MSGKRNLQSKFDFPLIHEDEFRAIHSKTTYEIDVYSTHITRPKEGGLRINESCT